MLLELRAELEHVENAIFTLENALLSGVGSDAANRHLDIPG
jgi:hypothetical protein